jgi:hypothetical protein
MSNIRLPSLVAIGAVAAIASTAVGPAAAQKKPAPAPAAAPLTQGQLDAAGRVYVGTAQCDEGKQVTLSKVDGKPGHFKLQLGKAAYVLVAQETDTGAVRLEDKKSGIVWLQIPTKSMLMNAKLGQRVADGCKVEQQRKA